MKAIVNGVALAYDDTGPREGAIPLVLVHGFPFRRDVWEPQIDAFRDARRVVTPDLRGFGESDAASGTTTMDQFAEDLHALLRHLATGPVALAGHSMGGYVALAFARRHPEMLRGLALVATRAGADAPEAAAARRAAADRAEAEGPDAIVEAMASKMLSPAAAPAAVRTVRSLMTPLSAAGAAAALRGMAARPDMMSMLPRVAVPTLVVTGADDLLIPPAESDRMARAIPDARLVVLPGAGHLVARERAEDFNRALAAWLAELPGPGR